MNDENLKRIWQENKLAAEKIDNSNSKTIKDMNTGLKKLERNIQKRDNLEVGAAILSIIYFAYQTVSSPELYKKIGYVLFIVYLLEVIFVLIKVKNAKPGIDLTASLKEQLVRHRDYVLRQQRLLKNVLWWYLLPGLPGLLVLHLGREFSYSVVLSLAFIFAVGAFIYFLNRRAAERDFNPLLTELNNAINGIEEH